MWLLYWICASILITKVVNEIPCDVKRVLHGKMLDCTGRDFNRLPDVEKTDYKYLIIKKCKKLKFYQEDFDGWINLYRIDLSEIPFSEQRGKVPLDLFSKLSVRNFSFNDGELTDVEMWIWPPRIEKLELNNNRYTRINVSMSPNLDMLCMNNNFLNDLPILSKSRKIVELFLLGNPMHDLTVEKLAPYCLLARLDLKLTADSHLLSSSGSCECKKLNLFMKTFMFDHYFTLPCRQPNIFHSLMECNTSLAEVKVLRSHCQDSYKLPLPYTKQSKWLTIFVVVGLPMFFFVLLLVLVYITYRTLHHKSEENEISEDENAEESAEEQDNVSAEENPEVE